MEQLRKRFTGVRLLKADAAKGEVAAVIATLNVKDADGDVILPGFFGEQETRTVWGHDWTEPLGTGKVYEDLLDGDRVAIGEASFIMGVPAIADRFATVKGMGDKQEWSFGWFFNKSPDGTPGFRFGEHTDDAGDTTPVRFFTPLEDGSPGGDVYEFSPVLLGAGQGTRTLSAKGRRGAVDVLETLAGLGDPEAVKLLAAVGVDSRYLDHVQAVADSIGTLHDRTVDIAAKRTADGKANPVGADSAEALAALADRLDNLTKSLRDVVTSPPADRDSADPPADMTHELDNLYLAHSAMAAQLVGVN